MPDANLVRRMKDFFERQRACCAAIGAELQTLPADVELETLERLAEEHRAQRAQTDVLAEEFAALQAEWDAAGMSSAEAEEVRGAARLAAEATERLAELNMKWKAWADERLSGLGADLTGLQRNREATHKYGVVLDRRASFVDEKA